MTDVCAKCGATLVERAAYCYSCGTKVDTAKGPTVAKEFSVSADDLTRKVKELLHEGNVTRIIVKDERGNTLIEIPATVGVVGVLIAPWLAALGVIGALATKCTLVVVRKEAPMVPT